MSEKSKYGMLVVNLGGTISCSEFIPGTDTLFDPNKHTDVPQVEVRPERGKIEALMRDHVDSKTLERFPTTINYKEDDVLKDSAEYTVTDLMRIVRNVRADLRKSKNRSQILTAGTDNAAPLVQAIAEGVPKDLLGDRSIIIAVSNDHVGNVSQPTNKHPAIVSLVNSLYLSTRTDEIKGRIGLCTGLNLFAPRGLVKSSTKGEAFHSRFTPIANAKDLPQPEWAYTLPIRPCDKPSGQEHDYLLAPGIETVKLSWASEYENTLTALAAQLNPGLVGSMFERLRFKKEKRKLNGVVMQAPGTGNLNQNEESLSYIVDATEMAAKEGVPVILIADPVQPQDFNPNDNLAGGYGGSFALIKPILDKLSPTGASLLIDGEDLTHTEATSLLSAAVARATEHHGYKGFYVIEYTQSYVDNYISAMSQKD
jgi:hypothetical protein